MKALIEQIKSRISPKETLLHHFPTHFREHGNCVCPMHDDSPQRPSLAVYENGYHCFGACQASFDVIDMTEMALGVSTKEAIEILRKEAGLDRKDYGTKKSSGKKQETRSKPTKDFLSTWRTLRDTPLSDEAVEYFEKKRGLTHLLPELTKAKLIGFQPKWRQYYNDPETGNLAFAVKPAIAFPVTSWDQQQLFGIQYVPLDGTDKKFHKGSSPKDGLFRYGNGGTFLVVTEAVIDALSVYHACNRRLDLEAISIFSASSCGKIKSLPGTPILFLDDDIAGIMATIKTLRMRPGRVRIVDWSMAPEGMKDVNDLLLGGHDYIIERMVSTSKMFGKTEIPQVIAALLERMKERAKTPKQEEECEKFRKEIGADPSGTKCTGSSSVTNDDDGRRRPTQADLLIACSSDAELFHSPDDGRFAVVPHAGHQEVWSIRSKGFRDWLSRRFYEQHQKAPSAQALQDALGLLGAKARFEGEERETFIRVGASAGKLYMDLADPSWRVIEIDVSGWRVLDQSPIMFRRTPGMLGLPEPQRGGSLTSLRAFVNTDDDAFKLMIAWLVQSLHPAGPYPILALEGEQGTGKSNTARMLRSLVDPGTAPLRTIPRDERDLLIAATNGWIIAFDNLSGVQPWLSDALCRLATGGGFSTRTLYSDSDETIFNAMRPQILTGIDRICSRMDLLDRSIVVTLASIPEEKRRPEAAIWHDFEAVRPRILGALCDAASAALRNLPNTKPDRLPRMADFALWVSAAESVLPWRRGDFMRAYAGARTESINQAIDSDPVASAIRHLMEMCGSWLGTSKELLDEMDRNVDEKTRHLKAWPQTPESLSKRLRRCAPGLRTIGVNISIPPRTSKARFLHIERICEKPSQLSQTVMEAVSPHESNVSSVTVPDDEPSRTVTANNSGILDNGSCGCCDGFLHTLSTDQDDECEEVL